MDFIKIPKVDNVQLEQAQSVWIGTLHLTAHHLIFNNADHELWIPYPLIHTMERRSYDLKSGRYPLHIRCRDFKYSILSMEQEIEAADVFESVQKLTCIRSFEQLYAFFYRPIPPLKTNNGWKIYDPLKEYSRMGVTSKTDAWRFTTINRNYTYCPTYPRVLVVPSKISDNVLNYAVKFRSKGRIPVLSYLHWFNQASISRSSQPMVGIKQNRSIQDEKLIEAIFQSNAPRAPAGQIVYGSTPTNLIVDARPTANAVANVAIGAGTENIENYKNCKKLYMNIDNIHVMRDSLARMEEAMQGSEMIGGLVNRFALSKSNWLKHISSILEGVLVIVRNIHIHNSNVLVHCSDGWDRTAQLTALSALCLDPYYRTIEGFAVLVEKEWVSFGHKFADRCGHLSNEKYFAVIPATSQTTLATMKSQLYKSQSHARETAPIFHQFLDAVYQLLRQFSSSFEFNQAFLLRLHYHLYSCQYGTFLFNSERERSVFQVEKRTFSIWDYVQSNLDEFRNKEYNPTPEEKEDSIVLLPDPKEVLYWPELFSRTEDEVNAGTVPGSVAGEGLTGSVVVTDTSTYSASNQGPQSEKPKPPQRNWFGGKDSLMGWSTGGSSTSEISSNSNDKEKLSSPLSTDRPRSFSTVFSQATMENVESMMSSLSLFGRKSPQSEQPMEQQREMREIDSKADHYFTETLSGDLVEGEEDEEIVAKATSKSVDTVTVEEHIPAPAQCSRSTLQTQTSAEVSILAPISPPATADHDSSTASASSMVVSTFTETTEQPRRELPHPLWVEE
ncbi:uncharacterized protein VTP21DRAFT_5911 [Calcarisporiella thermophila]|uniref:uncharacterized protein n=1 Tax=Calcarisporiella thermophila TaxID=911321 RepID=UPI0037428DC7